jgi:hypothetical protein
VNRRKTMKKFRNYILASAGFAALACAASLAATAHVSGGPVSFKDSSNVPVATPAATPPAGVFDLDMDARISGGRQSAVKKLVVTVPADRLLKIESIDGRATVRRDDTPSVEVLRNDSSTGLLNKQLQGSSPLDKNVDWSLSLDKSNRFFAKAGDTVEILFSVSSGGDESPRATAHLRFRGTYYYAP